MREPRSQLLQYAAIPYVTLDTVATDTTAWPVSLEMRPWWEYTAQNGIMVTEEDLTFPEALDYAEKEKELCQEELDETLERIKEATPGCDGLHASQGSLCLSPLLTHKTTRLYTTPAKPHCVDLVAQAANGPSPEVVRYTFCSPPGSPPLSPSPLRGVQSPLVLLDRKGLEVNEEDIPLVPLEVDIPRSPPSTPSSMAEEPETKGNASPLPRGQGVLSVRDMRSAFDTPSTDDPDRKHCPGPLTSGGATPRRQLRLETTEVDIHTTDVAMPVYHHKLEDEATEKVKTVEQIDREGSPQVLASDLQSSGHLDEDARLRFLARVASQAQPCSTVEPAPPIIVSNAHGPRRSSRILAEKLATIPPLPSEEDLTVAPLKNHKSSPRLDRRFKAEHMKSRIQEQPPEVHSPSDSQEPSSEVTTPVKTHPQMEKGVKLELLEEVLDQKTATLPSKNTRPITRTRNNILMSEGFEVLVDPTEVQGTRSWTRQSAHRGDKPSETPPILVQKKKSRFIPPKPVAREADANSSERTVRKNEGHSGIAHNTLNLAQAPSKRKGSSEHDAEESGNKRTRSINPSPFVRYSEEEMKICREVMRGKPNSLDLREKCRVKLLEAGYKNRSVDALKFKYKDANA